MNATKALFDKDRPWVLLLALGGLIALVAAIGDGGFFYSFALDSGRCDTEFHTAWISGLALGLVAASFDGVLGVSDYLRQRALDGGRIFRSRIRAIVTVLGIWLIGAPILAWCCMLAVEQVATFDLAALLSMQASCVVALSATAVGLFAGMLPTFWWLRLLIGGALFLTLFSAVFRITQLESGYHAVGWFVALHVLAALLFTGLAYAMRDRAADPDHAWPRSVRIGAGTVSVLGIVMFASAGLRESEVAAARWLAYEYPLVVLHEGQVRLVSRGSGSWGRHGVPFVDVEHARTGETVAASAVQPVHYRWPRPDHNWLGFDAPRWHAGFDSVWTDRLRVCLQADGRAWYRRHTPGFDAGLEPTGVGPDHRAFAAGSRIYATGGADDVVFVHERAGKRLYRFDADALHFVPLGLPDGDRLVTVDYRTLLPRFVGALGHESSWLIVGENGAYLPRGDGLAKVEIEPRRESARRDLPEATVTGGPIVATFELPAGDDRPAFTHEFRPRTFLERTYAGVALFFAGVQPPLANVFGAAIGVTALSFAFGALGAWLAARYLRRAGAPRHVRVYWVACGLLLGPLVLPLCVLLERPRAHRERARVVAPPPRIFTPLTAMEATR